jgi:hypothetical protein
MRLLAELHLMRAISARKPRSAHVASWPGHAACVHGTTIPQGNLARCPDHLAELCVQSA